MLWARVRAVAWRNGEIRVGGTNGERTYSQVRSPVPRLTGGPQAIFRPRQKKHASGCTARGARRDFGARRASAAAAAAATGVGADDRRLDFGSRTRVSAVVAGGCCWEWEEEQGVGASVGGGAVCVPLVERLWL